MVRHAAHRLIVSTRRSIMATPSMPVQAHTSAPSTRLANMTEVTAMRAAWLIFGVLMVIPFFLIFWLVWHQLNDSTFRFHPGGQNWFLASMIYFAVAVPGSLFTRERLFRPYWSGKPVPPAKYLEGMVIVWLALSIGGLLCLIGCIASGTMLPNLIPGIMSLMLYLTLWPSGRAMVHPTGNQEDPELYREPR
jgi:hypothetical protein